MEMPTYRILSPCDPHSTQMCLPCCIIPFTHRYMGHTQYPPALHCHVHIHLLSHTQAEVVEYYPPPAHALSGQGPHQLPAVIRVSAYVDLYEV